MPKLNVVLLVAVFCFCVPSFAQVYLQERDNVVYYGNKSVELALDAHSGYFLQIRNKQTGIEHKPAGEGVWPFGLTVGTRDKPEMMRAEIRSDGLQRMTWKAEELAGGAKRLVLTYAMLIDNATRQETGVGLGVNIDLAPEQPYFIIKTEIANGGGWWVTNFYAGKGELRTGDSSAENEEVHIPARGGFPRTRFRGMTLGLPTYGWGWSDYSGRQGGIGMAYVNPDGMQLVFDLKPLGRGVEQSWRLFDTTGYWHFESRMNDYQKSLRIQPLEPANNYVTGEWLLIPHAGDWHQVADVYRERYEKVFAGDYQSWATLPDRVKNLYVQFGFWMAENSIGNSYPRKVITRPEAVAGEVKKALDTLGLQPGRASVNMVFFHPHVGRYPEFFPVWDQLGGSEAMRKTLHDLHAMGIAYVIGYTHLSYNHRAAANYIAEADPGDTVPSINPTAGHRACIDNEAWARMWEKQLVPEYAKIGFDGVYADEGHFPWGTCGLAAPGHLHGPTAVGVLRANTRGVVRLHGILHRGLGPQSVIMVEGSGDVAGRWADANHAYPDPSVAYTLPFKRYIWGVDARTPEPNLSEHINLSLAHGYAIMANLQAGGKLPEPEPLRRYVATRERLDKERAPGYPYGFRDTVGVNATHPSIEVRSFADPKGGVTAVYYAKEAAEGDITVDGAALGFPSLGKQKRRVKLDKGQVDFWILRP